MKVHMCSEVLRCTERSRKATRDIQSTTKVDQNYLNTSYGPWAVDIDQIYWFLATFWPEMKVHMYCEVLGCAEISRKATRDIQSTIIVDQNHFNYKLWRLSNRYWPNVLILATFGFAMKAHRSSEAPRCTEISRKATRDIRMTSKVDQNHLEYKLWTLSRNVWQKHRFLDHMYLKTRKMHN